MKSQTLKITLLFLLSHAAFAQLGTGVDMKGLQREFPITQVVIEDDFFGSEEFYTLNHKQLTVKSAFANLFSSASSKFGEPVKGDERGYFSDPVAVSAYTNALNTVKHLREKLEFEFTSPINIVVDQYWEAPWSMESPNLSYSEAGLIRNLGLIAFSPGSENTTSLALSQDIVAHEIAHLVVAQTSKLEPSIGSQAINEAFGDIIGIYIESLEYPDSWNWKIGDESYKDKVSSHRDIQDINDPRVLRHKKDFTGERAHALSGIITTSFYYLVTGKDLSGIQIMSPTSMDDVVQLYFETITQDLEPNTNFTKLKEALLKRSSDDLTDKIIKAFEMVGV